MRALGTRVDSSDSTNIKDGESESRSSEDDEGMFFQHGITLLLLLTCE
jgi:hypothetical protein